MSRLFVILLLISLTYAQTELSSGNVTVVSKTRQSPCYSIYANVNESVNIEMILTLSQTSSIYILVSNYEAICNDTYADYNYYVSSIDSRRYTYTFTAAYSGYQYMTIQNYYEYPISFNLTVTANHLIPIQTNQSYIGKVSDSMIVYSFYSPLDDYDVYISTYDSKIYLSRDPSFSTFYYYEDYIDTTITACVTNTSNIGNWYIGLQSMTNYEHTFTVEITPSVSTRTLFTGSNSVLLYPGENYFEVYSPSTILQLNFSDNFMQYTYDFGYTTYTYCNTTDWIEYKSYNYIDHYFMWNVWTRTLGFQLFMVNSYESVPTEMLIEVSHRPETDIIQVDEWGAVATVTNEEELVYYRYINKNGTSLDVYTAYVELYIKEGSAPTTTDYDYYSSSNYVTSITTCSKNSQWYIAMRIPAYQTSNIYITSSYSPCTSTSSAFTSDSLTIGSSSQYYRDNILSPGAVAGIVIGCTFGCLCICSVFVLCMVKKARKNNFSSDVEMHKRELKVREMEAKKTELEAKKIELRARNTDIRIGRPIEVTSVTNNYTVPVNHYNTVSTTTYDNNVPVNHYSNSNVSTTAQYGNTSSTNHYGNDYTSSTYTLDYSSAAPSNFFAPKETGLFTPAENNSDNYNAPKSSTLFKSYE